MKTIIKILSLVILVYSFYSCNSNVDGCTDPTATNYDPNANNDDGSCIYPIVNNNNNTNPPPNYSNFCDYYVDGVSKTSQSFFTMINSGYHQLQAYQGSAGTFPDMAFYFDLNKPTGTYTNGSMFDLSANFQYLIGSNQPTQAFYGNGTTGSITITTHDLTNTYIEGTFYGTLYNQNGDSVVITNGTFGFDY